MKTPKEKKPGSPSLKIPSEKEIVHNIDVIIKSLGPNFQFGIYTIEDLRQEAWFWINEKIHLYDGERSLFNFMFTIIKRRLCNLKRNKYERRDPPCTNCPLNAFIDGRCTAFSNMMDCAPYASWRKINTQKKTLANTASGNMGPLFRETSEKNFLLRIENKDILVLIEDSLDGEMLEDFQALLNDKKIPYRKYQALILYIQEMLDVSK